MYCALIVIGFTLEVLDAQIITDRLIFKQNIRYIALAKKTHSWQHDALLADFVSLVCFQFLVCINEILYRVGCVDSSRVMTV